MNQNQDTIVKKIQDTFILCFQKKELHEITVKEICEHAEIPRTSFYHYFSDVYEVLESIEDLLVLGCKERNASFVTYVFEKKEYGKRGHFRETLLFIEANAQWFRTLLNKGKDGLFIYKWKKVIKEDFQKKFKYEKIYIPEEELVLEMIASGCIGAYTYWVNNLDSVPIEVVEREVLDRLCQDFFKEKKRL